MSAGFDFQYEMGRNVPFSRRLCCCKAGNALYLTLTPRSQLFCFSVCVRHLAVTFERLSGSDTSGIHTVASSGQYLVVFIRGCMVDLVVAHSQFVPKHLIVSVQMPQGWRLIIWVLLPPTPLLLVISTISPPSSSA
jgi:hypothetical protein